MLKIWLKEYRFSYNEVESLTHLCKIREEKLIECFDELLRLSRRIPYGKSLMKDVYIEIALMLESRGLSTPLPDYIVEKLYKEESIVFNKNVSDIISDNTKSIFEEYKLFATESLESDIVTNVFEKSQEEKEWENNLEDLICNFKSSSDKLCFAQDVAYDDSYTPSQKIIAISEFVGVFFKSLFNPSKNFEKAKEYLESINWYEVEMIADLVEKIYEEHEDFFSNESDCLWENENILGDTDNNLLQYKQMISVILNNDSIYEVLSKRNLCLLGVGLEQYYFDSIINIFALTNKCRYIVPYMVKELEDRMPEKDSENYADEVRYLYSMIEDIATYSDLAAKEVGPEDESYIKFMEVHKMANRMTDMIIDKPFELKEEKEE